MPGRPRRLAPLAEGRFTPADARTAVGVPRCRPDEVAAVLDSSRAGRASGEGAAVGGIVAVDAVPCDSMTGLRRDHAPAP